MGLGLGGNPKINTGQFTASSTAAPIPLPPEKVNVLFPGMWMIHICAGAADIFVGDSTVTTGTGYRVVANTSKDFYTQQQLYVIGTSGTVTYMWEYA
jgi:hypothetical protein